MKLWLIHVVCHPVTLLALGGAAGTNARYWLGHWIGSHPWGERFPLGTLVINVSGSFLFGLGAVVFLELLPASQRGWFLLLGTGFCGGFTTFSTFEYETFQLIQRGNWPLALVNVLGSVLAGFVAVALAFRLGEEFFPGSWD